MGLLDADVYGPSLPTMTGTGGKPESPDGKNFAPKRNHGLQVMSIGYMIEEDTPVIWRGPMVTQALMQLVNNTLWKISTTWSSTSARYRRHRSHPGPAHPGERGGHRHHAAGHSPAGCPQGAEDVREGRSAGAGHHREHGHPRVLGLRPRGARLRQRRRCAHGGAVRRPCSVPCRWTSRSASRPTPARPSVAADGLAAGANATARSRARSPAGCRCARSKAIQFPKIVIQNT